MPATTSSLSPEFVNREASLFCPTPERPLRAKRRWFSATDTVQPHRHDWAQLAYSPVGVLRLTTDRGTYLVPPSRAVWVPPGAIHAVTVEADTELRTLYLYQQEGRSGPAVPRGQEAVWRVCRVLEVSELLRALIMQLDVQPDVAGPLAPQVLRRERLLCPLVLDELGRATPVPLGVPLPQDKRLRSVCLAILDDPCRHGSLEAWAADAGGASARTLARLFRQELQTTYSQWRQQVLLARALVLAAQHRPLGQIATELGYANPSAFSAMVRRTLGQRPRDLFGPPRAGAARGHTERTTGATA